MKIYLIVSNLLILHWIIYGSICKQLKVIMKINTMELLIDNRESIKELFLQPGLNIRFANLLLGDYIFKHNEQESIIIERKTIEDYANSIRDGRHREQKSRLLSNYSNHQIIYLVEGNITKDNQSFLYNKVSKETIVSSIVNTMLRDNISVFHTKDISETIFFIHTLYKKLKKQGSSFMNITYSHEDALIQTNHKKKNKNLTKNTCQKMMFNTIPNISLITANRLLNHFGTIQKCISELILIDIDSRLVYLQNIPAIEGSKFRKISKKSCQNILDFLID